MVYIGIYEAIMDEVNNPFAPGAGSPPPEMVGRTAILEDANILFRRILNGKAEKSLVLTGLRGVGKTVLLTKIRHMAEEIGYRTISIEAEEGKSLAEMLIPKLRTLLLELDRMEAVSQTVRRGIAVLKSFANGLKVNVNFVDIVNLEVACEQGLADSGSLENDLPDLFVAIGKAAQDRNRGIAILIDEIQYLNKSELSALIMAMHKMQQEQLPLVMVGGGLPTLYALMGDSKSYSERLFNFLRIGSLSSQDSAQALQAPVVAEGVEFSPEALEEVFRQTQGYPYFLQEWGYQAWNLADTSPIDLEIVKEASDTAIKRLDENFFKVRFDRLAPKEKRYLRAMAELGHGPYKTGNIADKMQSNLNTLGPVRASLIKKGMIYSPSHGDMDFTVPLFDEFMRRTMPDF